MYFEEEEMAELKGSNLVALTEARIAQLRANYEEIFPFFFEKYPTVFDTKTFSLENFMWAISTVWKRSFFIREPGDVTAAVLIPLLDRFNHGPVETHFKLDEKDDAIEVTTKTAFKKGEQVFVSRGPKSNLELLLDFGYVLDENPNDNVALNVRMTGEDKLARVKVALLQLAGLEANATYLLYDSLISQELMKALRIQLLRDSELNSYDRATEGKTVSLGNELRVLRAILAACNNMLQQYGTSIEEDETLLKTKLPLRQRSAVVLRRNEKKVIQSIMLEVSKKWRDILLEGFAENDKEDKELQEVREQLEQQQKQQQSGQAGEHGYDKKTEL
jgi:histone-lysine N-methyltransferase SETD3